MNRASGNDGAGGAIGGKALPPPCVGQAPALGHAGDMTAARLQRSRQIKT